MSHVAWRVCVPVPVLCSRLVCRALILAFFVPLETTIISTGSYWSKKPGGSERSGGCQCGWATMCHREGRHRLSHLTTYDDGFSDCRMMTFDLSLFAVISMSLPVVAHTHIIHALSHAHTYTRTLSHTHSLSVSISTCQVVCMSLCCYSPCSCSCDCSCSVCFVSLLPIPTSHRHVSMFHQYSTTPTLRLLQRRCSSRDGGDA